MSIFKNLYNYRELLKTNVKKDIRGRYKGSFLGILWSFLNPLLQVVVYWIVFPYFTSQAVWDMDPGSIPAMNTAQSKEYWISKNP